MSKRDESIPKDQEKIKLMATMMDLDPKAAQKLQSKGGDLNKLYATEPKAIYFWFLYREVTGINSIFAKKRF